MNEEPYCAFKDTGYGMGVMFIQWFSQPGVESTQALPYRLDKCGVLWAHWIELFWATPENE